MRLTALAAAATGIALAAATNIHGAALLGGTVLAILFGKMSKTTAAMPQNVGA